MAPPFAGHGPSGVPKFLAQPSPVGPALQPPVFSDQPINGLATSRNVLAALVALQQFSSFVPAPAAATTFIASSVCDSPVFFDTVTVVDDTAWPPKPPDIVTPVVFGALATPPPLPRSLPQQREFVVTVPPVTVGAYSQPPVQIVQPFRVALQPFSAFTPQVSVPQGWYGPPAAIPTPIRVGQFRFSDFVPQPITAVVAAVYPSMADSLVFFDTVTVVDESYWAPKPPDVVITPVVFSLLAVPAPLPRPVAQQREFVVTISPVTVGAYSQPPLQVVAPFRVALQRFSGFAPFGQAVTVTPADMGAYAQSPVLFAKPFQFQRFSDFAPFGQSFAATPANMGAFAQNPVVFAKPYSVGLQPFAAQGAVAKAPPTLGVGAQWQARVIRPVLPPQFSHYVPTVSTAATPSQWWFSPSPALFAKPFPAPLQRFASFTSFGAQVLAQTPSQWWFGPSAWAFAKPVPATLQRFSAFDPQVVAASPVPDLRPSGAWSSSLDHNRRFRVPPTSVTVVFELDLIPTPPQWWFSPSPVSFIKPLAVSLLRFTNFAALDTVAPPQPSRALAGQSGASSQVRAQGFRSPPTSLTVVIPLVTPSPPQWWFSPSPVQFAKRFPVALQRFSGFVPRDTIAPPQPPRSLAGQSAATVQEREGHFRVPPTSVTVVYLAPAPVIPPPVTAAGSAATSQVRQRHFKVPPTSVTVVYELAGATPTQWWFAASPPRFAKRFPVELQRFSSFVPRGTIFSVTPQGWMQQVPVKFGKRYPVELQRFSSYPPQGTVVSTTPRGWMFQPPVKFGKPYPVALQRFQSFAPAGTLSVQPPLPPQGWEFQSPPRFGKPIPVALQRFASFAPRGAIVSVTPQGWMFQPPALFARPFAAKLQRFSSFAPQGTITVQPVLPPQGWWGQSPVKFGKPVPVALQRFSAFAPAGTITVQPPLPPQGWMHQRPVLFGKRFPVELQRFSAYTPRRTPTLTPQGTPEGIGLKNEIERCVWLMGHTRVVWLRNELQRNTTLQSTDQRVTLLQNERIRAPEA